MSILLPFPVMNFTELQSQEFNLILFFLSQVSTVEGSTKLKVQVLDKVSRQRLDNQGSTRPRPRPSLSTSSIPNPYSSIPSPSSKCVVPVIDSSLLIVSNHASPSGHRMWMWNINVWLRLNAEVQLKRDDRATAPPTYKDGSPKKRSKETRIQDKGFESPHSFPNVFTPEEWSRMEEVLPKMDVGCKECMEQGQRATTSVLPLNTFPDVITL